LRHVALVSILALALVARLANLSAIARLPHADAQFHWEESDMATSYLWSGRILQGAFLTRAAPRTYTEWMRDMAPLET
jgi:hypothetical protein